MSNPGLPIESLARQEDLRWAKEIAAQAESLRNANGGHWGHHPDYPVEEWQREVEGFDTRLGYWEWIANAMSDVARPFEGDEDHAQS